MTSGFFVIYPTGGAKNPYYNTHEPGHALQYLLMGPGAYISLIIEPSLVTANSSNAKEMPWEKSASTLSYWLTGKTDPAILYILNRKNDYMENKQIKSSEMYRYSNLMKSNKHWWLFGIICVIFSMCDMDNHKLVLINSTNKHYFYRLLADTTDLKKGLYIYPIAAHDSVYPLFVRGGDGAWEYQINKYSPDSTLNIYLFDSSEITEKVIRLHEFKKISYRVKELENLKWKINIP